MLLASKINFANEILLENYLPQYAVSSSSIVDPS